MTADHTPERLSADYWKRRWEFAWEQIDEIAAEKMALAAHLADVEARVERLGSYGGPDSLMEAIRRDFHDFLPGDDQAATLGVSRVMFRIREHIRAALHPDPSEPA